jgi:hypothetical protein
MRERRRRQIAAQDGEDDDIDGFDTSDADERSQRQLPEVWEGRSAARTVLTGRRDPMLTRRRCASAASPIRGAAQDRTTTLHSSLSTGGRSLFASK